MENYHFNKYKCDINNLNEKLNKYGVAIIPNILNESEIIEFKNGVWEYLNHITKNFDIPIDKNNEKSYRSFRNLFALHSMLIQHWGIGHAQFNWDLRQNKKIVDVFAKIWNVKSDELLTSFDGASIHFPPEITNLGWYRGNDWFHCDQTFTFNNLKSVQSWVTAFDVNPGDATLAFLEKSNNYHKDFQEHFNITDKKDWYKLNENEIDFYIKNKNCEIKYIKCPAGSMVLWDSRTIHCGRECMKSRKTPNFRFVSYICMMPRKDTSKKIIKKRIEAFENLRTTTHLANNIKLFPKNPRTYGKELPEINEIEKPVLSDLGLKLVGY